MMLYDDFKIGDMIFIPKGTAIWCMKLQRTIVLYDNIIAKITHSTTTKDSFFVQPQKKILKPLYINFHSSTNNGLFDYVDDEIFGELHYVYNEDEFINNDRKYKLEEILK